MAASAWSDRPGAVSEFIYNATSSLSESGAMAYLYFVHPVLPPSVLAQRVIDVLQRLSERPHDSKFARLMAVKLLSGINASVRGLEENIEVCVELSSCLVQVWFDATSWTNSADVDELLDSLEGVLNSLLSSMSLESTAALAAFSERSVEEIVSRCLGREKRSHGASLLPALIATDVLRFRNEFLSQLSSQPTRQIHGNCKFDNSFLCILKSGTVDEPSRCVLEIWKEDFASRCCNFISSLSNTTPPQSSILDVLAQLLDLNEVEPQQLKSLAETTTALLSEKALLKSSPTLSTRLLDCAVKMCFSIPDSKRQVKGALSSLLFRHLCEIGPRSLRYHMGNRVDATTECPIAPNTLLYWTQKVADRVCKTGDWAEIFSTKALYSMIRSCLRNGLSRNDFQNQQTTLLCLRTVNSLVIAASGTSSGLSSSTPLPEQVTEMVTSHSSFRSICEDESGSAQKSEMVLMLLSCIPRTKKLKFDQQVWGDLLRAYHAGVEKVDLDLRELLWEYWQLADEVSSLQIVSPTRCQKCVHLTL